MEFSFIEKSLLVVVLLTLFTTFLFFFMTLHKKLVRLKENKQKRFYQEKIDKLLFEFLFGQKSVQEVIALSEFQKYFSDQLFQKVSIKAIIALHHNYSGTYSRKLEVFYAESGLVNYSLAKLNARKWPFIVEGIRDLSTLNYQKAYARIVSVQNHKNTFVQTEVLIGMIKLKGITEVLKFGNRNVYLNDWVQSNILFAVKKHNIDAPEDLTDLFRSKNRSVLLLAVRLINYYKTIEHYEALSVFYEKTKDVQLKREIAVVLRKTEQIH